MENQECAARTPRREMCRDLEPCDVRAVCVLQCDVSSAAVRGRCSGCSSVLDGSNDDPGGGSSADAEDDPAGQTSVFVKSVGSGDVTDNARLSFVPSGVRNSES